MTNIVFAIPRHPYTSYSDLYKLIDLSGYQSVFIDQIDPASENAYIITILNGELPAGGYPDARAKIVIWDNEWHMDGVPPLANVEYWASDRWYADRIGAKYVPMGSHPDLAIDPGESHYADDFDVAFIGYFDGVPRRQIIRQQLTERGVKVSPTGAWGTARAALLRQSWMFLHVHQHEHAPTIAPLRMCIAAAYKLPVITETVADAGIFRHAIRQYPYETLPEGVRESVSRPARPAIVQEGDMLSRLLCHDLTFRKSVEAAL